MLYILSLEQVYLLPGLYEQLQIAVLCRKKAAQCTQDTLHLLYSNRTLKGSLGDAEST